MSHPAEVVAGGMEKRGWFWAALPWLLMAAPMVTQAISRFRGPSSFESLQVPQHMRMPHHFGPRHALQHAGLQQLEQHIPQALQGTPFEQVIQGLHGYRSGAGF